MRFKPFLGAVLLSLAAANIPAGTARAQLGGLGVGGLPGGLGEIAPRDRLPPILPEPGRTVDDTLQTVQGAADNATQATAGIVDAVGRPPAPAALIDADRMGARVVRAEILALSPSPASLAAAQALNFSIVRQEALGIIGTVVVLRAPDGTGTADALDQLRAADPAGIYDFNHLYDPTGESNAAVPSGASAASDVAVSGQRVLGMVDGGVNRAHPSLRRGAIIAANVIGAGESPPSAHGTAVASLLIGEDKVKGALRGATLYAADVYGGSATGGSADLVMKGVAWLTEKGVPVINISLVGPPNRTLEAVLRAAMASGHVIVAAAGNDGPAVPVGYPAAYDGVIAITSVDDEGRVQIDANRGPEIVFAARGVNVAVAGDGTSYARATGTSFAAPLVAARFAAAMERPDRARALSLLEIFAREATDLGEPGRDPVFGYGLLETQPLAAGSARLN